MYQYICLSCVTNISYYSKLIIKGEVRCGINTIFSRFFYKSKMILKLQFYFQKKALFRHGGTKLYFERLMRENFKFKVNLGNHSKTQSQKKKKNTSLELNNS